MLPSMPALLKVSRRHKKKRCLLIVKAKALARPSTAWRITALSHGYPSPLFLASLSLAPIPSGFSRQIVHVGDSVACKTSGGAEAVPGISSDPRCGALILVKANSRRKKGDDSIGQRTCIQTNPLHSPSYPIQKKCCFFISFRLIQMWRLYITFFVWHHMCRAPVMDPCSTFFHWAQGLDEVCHKGRTSSHWHSTAPYLKRKDRERCLRQVREMEDSCVNILHN